jgi:hypothetical protein
MSKCSLCGKKFSFWNSYSLGKDTFCPSCYKDKQKYTARLEEQQRKEELKRSLHNSKKVNKNQPLLKPEERERLRQEAEDFKLQFLHNLITNLPPLIKMIAILAVLYLLFMTWLIFFSN